ncbi:MAG: hypothetical protein AB7K24_34620, partial [Gemmataceae bacterium]
MTASTGNDLVLLIHQRLAQGNEASEPERELAKVLRARLRFFNLIIFIPATICWVVVFTGIGQAPHWGLADDVLFVAASVVTGSLF